MNLILSIALFISVAAPNYNFYNKIEAVKPKSTKEICDEYLVDNRIQKKSSKYF